MKFVATRDVEARVFSVTIGFESLGNDTLTAEEESELFVDFGYPVINIGGEYLDESGEQAFVLNKKEMTLDEGFTITQSFKVDKKLRGEALDNAVEEAVNNCEIFEKELMKRAEDAIRDIHKRVSDFEDGYPKDFII